MRIKKSISSILFILALSFFFGCAHKYRYESNPHEARECRELNDGLSGVSMDPNYAYSMSSAVRIGGDGSENELKYLQMLLGPNKEFIDGFFKVGDFIDKDLSLSGYKAILKGDTLEKILYLDSHHCRDPKAPVGFTVREEIKELNPGSSDGKVYEIQKRSVPR